MSHNPADKPHPPVILLGRQDNVAVAARPLPKDFTISVPGMAEPVVTRELIALGHKVAVRTIPAGEPVLKYGQIIGFAARQIDAGQRVPVPNMRADGFGPD